jgi:large subunit ribosomal protein L7/L12
MSKVQGLISEIKNLSVVEVLELVDMLQTEFGVSALAATAAPAQTANVGAAEAVAKTNFKVELIDAGVEKTKVIKALRAIKKEIGLIEAKNATENLPFVVFAEANKDDTENAKKLLEEAGAKVKIS